MHHILIDVALRTSHAPCPQYCPADDIACTISRSMSRAVHRKHFAFHGVPRMTWHATCVDGFRAEHISCTMSSILSRFSLSSEQGSWRGGQHRVRAGHRAAHRMQHVLINVPRRTSHAPYLDRSPAQDIACIMSSMTSRAGHRMHYVLIDVLRRSRNAPYLHRCPAHHNPCTLHSITSRT